MDEAGGDRLVWRADPAGRDRHPGRGLVPRRPAAGADPWALVCDPTDRREPQAFLSTRLDDKPADIFGCIVSRWRVETTFQEVRRHLGVETQRQWSDLAILRTAPALLGLFSLITLCASQLTGAPAATLRPQGAAWYDKREPTFSDAIAAVRRALWCPRIFRCPGQAREQPKSSRRSCTGWSRPCATPREDSKFDPVATD